MLIRKQARPTLTAVEMDHGDVLEFALADGSVRRITLKDTGAALHRTTLDDRQVGRPAGVTHYQFHAKFDIDGYEVVLVRDVATARSFQRPRALMGLHLWLDAVDDIFEKILTEDHGPCRPRKKARIALQDATLRICPPLVHPWCPLPTGGLRIEDCYTGADCWLGAYFGVAAHGGLDINHPAGTPLWTPIALDDHEMYDRVNEGANNNRWRGTRRWADGATWTLQSAHVIRLLVDEHTPLEAGIHYAEAAGVLCGAHEHSHFVFRVAEPDGEEVLLDPWILFHQMYADRRATTAPEGF
jgi:hypothetical protein